MPRRIQIISPNLELNKSFTARFDDGSWLIIRRDFYGYHVIGGKPHFDCATKEELDAKLSFIAEDRGFLDKIDLNHGILGVAPDGGHIAELFGT